MRKFWGVLMVILSVILILLALEGVSNILSPNAVNTDTDASTIGYKLGQWAFPLILALLAVFLFIKGLKIQGVKTGKVNFKVATGKDVDYPDDYSNQPPSI